MKVWRALVAGLVLVGVLAGAVPEEEGGTPSGDPSVISAEEPTCGGVRAPLLGARRLVSWWWRRLVGPRSSAAAPVGFVPLPPGTFWMGSPADEPGREPNEVYHRASITRPFWLSMTEVTQGEWRETMLTRPARFADCGDDCPVEMVSWLDALSYANARSLVEGLPLCYDLLRCRGVAGTGCAGVSPGGGASDFWCESVRFHGTSCLGYRLPTEAEWEYGARAGAESEYACGPDISPAEARFDPETGKRPRETDGPTGVGTYPPNDWELYDMEADIYEWVWDADGEYDLLDGEDPGASPTEVTVVSRNRVVRGGSFSFPKDHLRSANRSGSAANARWDNDGFRLARTIPDGDPEAARE